MSHRANQLEVVGPMLAQRKIVVGVRSAKNQALFAHVENSKVLQIVR